jgi:hypothetical protein
VFVSVFVVYVDVWYGVYVFLDFCFWYRQGPSLLQAQNGTSSYNMARDFSFNIGSQGKAMFDVERLRLTDQEVHVLHDKHLPNGITALREYLDAQLAKALWGLAEVDEYILLNLEKTLEAAGIPRPQES